MIRTPAPSALLPPPSDVEFALIARLLHDHAGIVISSGKQSMVQSRLGKRLRKLGLDSYASYLDLVTSVEGQEERRAMISALTTNVTQFFRESHHFETLREVALPPLIARAREGATIRIWSAGCSNGQEPFSIAMVLADLAPDIARLDVRILATDIDPQIIAVGRAARYDARIAETVPASLRRFLIAEAGNLRVAPEITSLVTFRELNLHEPWPMRRLFDIIFCRNVVIYFDSDAQRRLWHRFAAALQPGGWLFVGHSERVPPDISVGLRPTGVTTYRLAASPTHPGDSEWR